MSITLKQQPDNQIKIEAYGKTVIERSANCRVTLEGDTVKFEYPSNTYTGPYTDFTVTGRSAFTSASDCLTELTIALNGGLCPFVQLLDTTGDGTGTSEILGDYSTVNDIFFCQPPANEIYEIIRIIVYVRDGATPRPGGYGSNASPLANGIILRLSDSEGVIRNFTETLVINTNGDWKRLGHDLDSLTGSGSDSYSARITFTRMGAPIMLNGARGEKFELLARDDFTYLLNHTVTIEGTHYYI